MGIMTADLSIQRGVFTWVHEKDDNLDFASAAWSTRSQTSQSSPDSLDLEVPNEVRCSICGELMMKEKEAYWDSPYKLTNVIYVTPFCLPCIKRAEENPEYWLEHLPHLFRKESRPSLRLIYGSRNGAAEPRRTGHLQLVKSDEEEEN